MTPFDTSQVEAKVFRTRIIQVPHAYGDAVFTDVTFSYLGEFYGCRFPGAMHAADLDAARRRFQDRQRNRDWDRR